MSLNRYITNRDYAVMLLKHAKRNWYEILQLTLHTNGLIGQFEIHVNVGLGDVNPLNVN